jgi:HK97 family phage prohead protease
MKTFELALSGATTDTKTRTVSGIAAPYNVTGIAMNGTQLSILAGAFGDLESLPKVQIFWGHEMSKGGVPIGRVTKYTDSPEGLHIEATISETEKGNEVYQLLKDGVLDSFSVGFQGTEHELAEDGTYQFSALELLEISVVSRPALKGASVLHVASADVPETEVFVISAPSNTNKETHMSDNVNVEMGELRNEVTELSRSVALLADSTRPVETAPNPADEIQSLGEYVKAVAKGDDKANEIYAAYTGGKLADVKTPNSWVEDAIVRVQKPRKLINAFSKGTLPATGNVLEFKKWNANTLAVDIQANEGDDLVWGKFSFTSATAPVITAGGGTSLSRQEIERGDENVVGEAFEGLSTAYGARTEAYFRTQYISAASTSASASYTGSNPDSLTGFVVDAAGTLEDGGLTADFVVVSRDVFKTLSTVHVGTNGEYFLSRAQGTVNLKGISGDLAGIPFVVISGTTGHFSVCSADAMRTYESGGAPFRLQDENIVNLTKDFSVYGYIAVANRIQGGIVRGVAA